MDFVKEVDARLSNNDNLPPPLPIPLGYIFFPTILVKINSGFIRSLITTEQRSIILETEHVIKSMEIN
jgi:hypothetical protein